MAQEQLTWGQTQYPIQWDNNPYTWDEVFVVIGLAQSVSGGHAPHDAYKHLKPEKKKVLIKLIAKIKGEEIELEKYKVDDIRVTASDVELVLKEVLNIQVNQVE